MSTINLTGVDPFGGASLPLECRRPGRKGVDTFGGRAHHKFKRGAKFSFEATLNIWCQRKNHVGSTLPKVLLNTQVVCFLTLVKSLNSEFCRVPRVPIFGSISSISLQQRKYDKIYSVHSKELAESYTLIPVTIFRVAGWGNPNFRY